MSFALLMQGAATAAADAASEATTGQLLGAAGMFLLLGLALLSPARRIEHRLLGPARPAPDVYLWGDLSALIGLFVLFQIAFMGYLHVTSGDGELGAATASDTPPPVDFLVAIQAGIAMFSILSAYVVITSFARKGGASALGVRPLTPQRIAGGRVLAGIARYMATVPFFLAVAGLVALGYQAAGHDAPVQDVAVEIEQHIGDHTLLVVLFAVVLQPLFEEILFRGYFLEFLRARFGVLAGVVVSSLAFGFAHGLGAAAPLTVFAVALAWTKLRTGSLAAVVLLHALHNGVQVAILYSSVSSGAHP